jgi:CPA2 family monovalent cation:H+ antiporter-2
VRVYAARMLVIATNAPSAVPRVVRAARAQNPGLHVLVRANYLGDVPGLQQAGVDEIVPQELETSVELLSRCLRYLLVAEDDVQRELLRIRRDTPGGRTSRSATASAPGAELPVPVAGLRAAAFRVETGSAVADRQLGEARLRRDAGVSVVALSRDGQPELAIGPETLLTVDDVAVCIGSAEALRRAASAFRGSGAS